MLELLRIKCPSCGIILDVRNSKHEAVKRIVCPHCQKQLAIDFQEEEKPVAPPKPLGTLFYGEMRIALHEGVNEIPLADCKYVEIRVVRLTDGNSKCMVHPTDEVHDVMVNGQKMQADDQVTLAKGDQLQIGNITLVYDKPGKMVATPKRHAIQESHASKERPFSWLYAALACAVLAIVVIVLWPSVKSNYGKSNQTQVTADTILQKSEPQDSPTIRINEREKPKKAVKKTEKGSETQTNYSRMNDYTLEQLAAKGVVEAQYELGNRLTHQSGSNNVIRGINYLHIAAKNGSSKARIVLDKAITSLRQRAEKGDSIAYHILMSIK